MKSGPSHGITVQGACLGFVVSVLAPGVYGQADKPSPQQFFERLGSFSAAAERMFPTPLQQLSQDDLEQLEQVEVPWTTEKKFGQQVLARFEKSLRQRKTAIIRRGRDVEYLNQLIETIQPLMKHARKYSSIRVSLIDVPEADAFSIPGGELLFTRGLLETGGSEAALVGVVAHELSHLDRGHQLLRLKQQQMLRQSTDMRQMFQSSMGLMRPFHPELETQADDDALRWMIATDYDARELAELLTSWDQRQNARSAWLDVMPGFLRSHPDAGARSRRIRSQYAAAEKTGYVGRKNLELRISRRQREFPE